MTDKRPSPSTLPAMIFHCRARNCPTISPTRCLIAALLAMPAKLSDMCSRPSRSAAKSPIAAPC